MKYTVLIFTLSIFLITSCSTTKEQVKSFDAVRIKKEIVEQRIYDTVKIDNNIAFRNASALKGKALRFETTLYKCRKQTKAQETVLLFKSSEPGANIERIPLEHIDLVGLKSGVETGFNWFEHYNDPLNPPILREIPIDTIIIADCSEGEPEKRKSRLSICGCEDINAELRCPWAGCRDNFYKNYFIEIRGGYATYNDQMPAGLGEKGRTAIMGEIASGWRFGSRKQWGIGLALSTGVPLYNSSEFLQEIKFGKNGEPISFYKPTIMLHSRYGFEETYCIRPFIYGQLGIAFDDLTLELANYHLGCADCKRKLESQGDFSFGFDFPLSYSFGIGVDVPIACLFDVSFDFGFRSIAIGEKSPTTLFGMAIPVSRRVNIFVFRFGITI